MSDQTSNILLIGLFYFVCGWFTFIARWSGSVADKKEFLINLLCFLGWPLVFAYTIFIVAPKAFYRFWANLPDEQSPTQK